MGDRAPDPDVAEEWLLKFFGGLKMKVIEEGLSAQLEEVNNKMGQVGFLFNYLLFIIGINFKVGDYAKVCQGAIKNGLKRR